MPRFEDENYAANLQLLDRVQRVARDVGCSSAQLALAWLLGRGEHIIPIPGTTQSEHLRENFSALDIKLNPAIFGQLDEIISQSSVAGNRYNATTQAEIDTEEFA
jgi:aryl-alcohol dehydrogenase-like predicted oxidoreductase